jgi:hypothetical protein
MQLLLHLCDDFFNIEISLDGHRLPASSLCGRSTTTHDRVPQGPYYEAFALRQLCGGMDAALFGMIELGSWIEMAAKSAHRDCPTF